MMRGIDHPRNFHPRSYRSTHYLAKEHRHMKTGEINPLFAYCGQRGKNLPVLLTDNVQKVTCRTCLSLLDIREVGI